MDSSPSELVVVLKSEAVASARSMLEEHTLAGRLGGISLSPFSTPSALALERLARSGESSARRALRVESARFVSGSVRDRSLDSALDEVRSLPEVETAYWKPGVENPLAPPSAADLADSQSSSVLASDFRSHQGYLDAEPGGVNVATAWSRTGGTGAGVRVIDIEGGWRLTHIDLLANSGGLLGGSQYPERSWRDHGTAVLGVMGGDSGDMGVTGICPDAILSCVSHGTLGSRGAIETATGFLRAGDVMLLEMHRPGPRFDFGNRDDQKGYIAIEWWPDDLLAIRSAVAKGITVVEAAGNGGEDFDGALYDTPAPGFPATWRNPFAGAIDSGAVMVGAGAPPGGVHGPDLSRLDFSNWGSRVDCQGWGRGVFTTGYGDFFSDVEDAGNEDFWYTSAFSGTSSASPIVAGVVACLQGIAKAAGIVLTPLELRAALRATGSAQKPSSSSGLALQNIGTRPNLGQLLSHLGL